MRSFGTGSRVGHDSSDFYRRKMFTESSNSEPKLTQRKHVLSALDESLLNQTHLHSSEDMWELPDESVHLMVTSPPYNVGKDYDRDLPLAEYRNLLKGIWRETYRVLVDGGRACINVANIGRKPYLPLNAIIALDMSEIGFLMRGEIIWNKSASAGTSCAWGSWLSPSNPVLRDVHEYILVFSKGRFGRNNLQGEPSLKRDDFLEWTKSVWNFPAASAKATGHPAPFPIELPKRLIHLYSSTNELVLDPFMGSGTTGLAAEQADRRWIGYETSREYCDLANARTESTKIN